MRPTFVSLALIPLLAMASVASAQTSSASGGQRAPLPGEPIPFHGRAVGEWDVTGLRDGLHAHCLMAMRPTDRRGLMMGVLISADPARPDMTFTRTMLGYAIYVQPRPSAVLLSFGDGMEDVSLENVATDGGRLLNIPEARVEEITARLYRAAAEGRELVFTEPAGTVFRARTGLLDAALRDRESCLGRAQTLVAERPGPLLPRLSEGEVEEFHVARGGAWSLAGRRDARNEPLCVLTRPAAAGRPFLMSPPIGGPPNPLGVMGYLATTEPRPSEVSVVLNDGGPNVRLTNVDPGNGRLFRPTAEQMDALLPRMVRAGVRRATLTFVEPTASGSLVVTVPMEGLSEALAARDGCVVKALSRMPFNAQPLAAAASTSGDIAPQTAPRVGLPTTPMPSNTPVRLPSNTMSLPPRPVNFLSAGAGESWLVEGDLLNPRLAYCSLRKRSENELTFGIGTGMGDTPSGFGSEVTVLYGGEIVSRPAYALLTLDDGLPPVRMLNIAPDDSRMFRVQPEDEVTLMDRLMLAEQTGRNFTVADAPDTISPVSITVSSKDMREAMRARAFCGNMANSRMSVRVDLRVPADLDAPAPRPIPTPSSTQSALVTPPAATPARPASTQARPSRTVTAAAPTPVTAPVTAPAAAGVLPVPVLPVAPAIITPAIIVPATPSVQVMPPVVVTPASPAAQTPVVASALPLPLPLPVIQPVAPVIVVPATPSVQVIPSPVVVAPVLTSPAVPAADDMPEMTQSPGRTTAVLNPSAALNRLTAAFGGETTRFRPVPGDASPNRTVSAPPAAAPVTAPVVVSVAPAVAPVVVPVQAPVVAVVPARPDFFPVQEIGGWRVRGERFAPDGFRCLMDRAVEGERSLGMSAAFRASARDETSYDLRLVYSNATLPASARVKLPEGPEFNLSETTDGVLRMPIAGAAITEVLSALASTGASMRSAQVTMAGTNETFEVPLANFWPAVALRSNCLARGREIMQRESRGGRR